MSRYVTLKDLTDNAQRIGRDIGYGGSGQHLAIVAQAIYNVGAAICERMEHDVKGLERLSRTVAGLTKSVEAINQRFGEIDERERLKWEKEDA